MSPDDLRAGYRHMIDELVLECRDGEGRIAADRIRGGSRHVTPQDADEERRNALLARLGPGDREVVAGMVQESFVGGVHTTLRVLGDEGVPPFDESYEGTPYQDFMGRLIDWEWPEREIP